MCAHKDQDMMPRRNRPTCKWFTCKGCLSRWERLPGDSANYSAPMDRPHDLDRVNFGKHTGETFLEVYQNDPGYVSWILESMTHGEPSPAMNRLAAYFHQKQFEETVEADDWDLESNSSYARKMDLEA